jgi:tetratricopeptide (TPR) repeat protein
MAKDGAMRDFKLRPQGLFRTTILSICMGLSASVAWAEVDQAVLEKAEALTKSGKAEQAYLLLEPLEVDGAGDLVYDYLLGTAALESNRPSKATFVYERILAVAPNYVGVRADMGRAYFALGDFGRAKIEFETVLAFQNIPQDLRGTVEQYVKAAEARTQNKRTIASGYVEFGIGRDTNIGSANAADLLNYPGNAAATPPVVAGSYAPGLKSDNYATLGLGGEVNHQLTDRWGVYLGGDYRGRGYQTYCDNTCNWTLDGRTGVSYSGGAWLVKAGLSSGTYNLNQAPYRDTLGLNLDWRLALESGSQLSAGISTSRANYLSSSTVSQNTQTNSVSAGWLTSVGDGSAIFSLTFSGGSELAVGGRTDGNRDFYGPRVLFQKSFNEKLGAYITSGVTYSKYAGTNDLYGVSRDESSTDVAVGVTWSVGKGLSVRPQLSYVKNISNADLYAYDKTDASVNLRLDF